MITQRIWIAYIPIHRDPGGSVVSDECILAASNALDTLVLRQIGVISRKTFKTSWIH